MERPLTDNELREALKWTQEDADAIKGIGRGQVTRGAFAQVAALKLRLEASHHGLIKEQIMAAPLVILLEGEDAARVVLPGQIVEEVEDQGIAPVVELGAGDTAGGGEVVVKKGSKRRKR